MKDKKLLLLIFTAIVSGISADDSFDLIYHSAQNGDVEAQCAVGICYSEISSRSI